jgi:hypothetical protein
MPTPIRRLRARYPGIEEGNHTNAAHPFQETRGFRTRGRRDRTPRPGTWRSVNYDVPSLEDEEPRILRIYDGVDAAQVDVIYRIKQLRAKRGELCFETAAEIARLRAMRGE